MSGHTAKDLILRAVTCDEAGRILEAQILYEEGIEQLMEYVTQKIMEDDKRRLYYARIQTYIDRAQCIKERVNRQQQRGEIVLHLAINDDDTGHNYRKLFGKYLDNTTKEILLEESYLMENYQFQNLIRFLELAVENCKELKFVRIVTKSDPNKTDNERSIMGQIISDMGRRNICMSVKYEDSLHDRRIVLSNGYIIKIGRGLHFFKACNPMYSLGLGDHQFRKCMKTDVDVWRTK